MADNNEMSIDTSFSIQDTIELGAGSQELLNGLLEPETSTAKPEDITPITTTVEDNPITKKTEVVDDKKQTNTLASFLTDGQEDEEETTTTDQTTITPVNEHTQEEASQFELLSNDLLKLGVFTQEEGEEIPKTPEEFLEKFSSEKKKGAQEIVENFIGQFGEDYQNAFDAIFVKGVDPKEYFTTYNNIVNFAELDLTQESNQRKVVKQALLDQGYEEDEADAEVERIQGYGDLEQVSQKHHKVLVKKETKKLAEIEENSQRVLQQKAQIRNQYISNVQSILEEKVKTKDFDGIPVNPKLASEVSDYLLVDKWKTPSGETLSDFDREILDLKKPENHSKKVKYALLLKLLEKDPTLSTIQKAGVTTSTNKLFESVTRQTAKKPITTNTTQSAPWANLK